MLEKVLGKEKEGRQYIKFLVCYILFISAIAVLSYLEVIPFFWFSPVLMLLVYYCLDSLEHCLVRSILVFFLCIVCTLSGAFYASNCLGYLVLLAKECIYACITTLSF